MLTVAPTSAAPGIIEGVAAQTGNAARRRRSSQRVMFQRRAGSIMPGGRNISSGRDSTTEIRGISMDRLTYINTALDALPGFSLREYFVPIMRLKKQLLLRQRKTKERFPAVGSAAYTKMITDAVTSLAKSLNTAGGDLLLDGGTASLDIDPKSLAERLQGKLSPICMEAGSVLSYPREPPESSFVYVVLSGTVTAMYFQPQPLPAQQRRSGAGGGGGGGRKERQMYFTSAKDVVRLCGGGITPEAGLFLDDSNNNGADSGATVEAASMSNVTTAIQRSLRRASRTVGQPTLQYSRMEQLRGLVVLGATEAIGLAPCKYVTYMASTEPSAPAGKNNRSDEPEMVHAFRVRTADVHAAVIQLAAEQQAERQGRSPFRIVPWCAAPAGEVIARGAVRTIADFVVAARRRTLYNDYAAMELMMRQSWLLQDAPSHTIRTLIAHLEPRTYMPGEVIACPHTHGGERQLCFLRRGRLNVYTVLKGAVNVSDPRSGSASSLPHGGATSRSPRDGCECWVLSDASAGAQPAEVVESGASFGELSVLFHEPRHCVLRADTVCDAWCLPRRSFTSLMQRDASLRDGLLQKAAVLRIEWMSEQRFTRALAQQLRASSELLHPLPDIAIRLIQERLEPVVFAPGSLVVSTSTKCGEMIFLMHGSVSTICEGVATYGPGDVLGEGCLVPHRWPLGLAARTMVEGWRIKADQLGDAFRRMDTLHRYSGLVTSQTPQLMKQIFSTPLPDIEVDAVGRQRMPTVGAAPCGSSFLAYGRAVSEVQLKATCLLYRDYVRWEDINYATIDGGKGGAAQRQGTSLDTLARALAIHRLDGGKEKSVAAALAQQEQQRPKATAPTTAVTAEAPGAENDGAADTVEGRKGALVAGSGCNAVRAGGGRGRGAHPSKSGARGPRTRVASAGAFLVKSAFLSDRVETATKHSGTSPSASVFNSATATGGAVSSRGLTVGARDRSNIPLPPRLQRMTRLLEERNRTWAAEQRHEATLVQQETNQREAAVRDQVAQHASSAAAATAVLHASSRTLKKDGEASGAAAARSASSHFSPTDVAPAPVHIFLQADKPKHVLDLKEAISIGYVMQLPDITHIQYSVSLVDPDVALGPPEQRGRRHLMSVTPNDRYNKHNFLFAAAAIEDGSSPEAQRAAAESATEVTLRSKARKLYAMMRMAVATRMDMEADLLNSSPHRRGSGECSPDTDSVAARPPDTLMLADELHVRSPRGDAESIARSPPIAHRTPSPKDAQRLQMSTSPMIQSASMATPSPFRGSPSKSAAQRSEEAQLRLLQRDPVQAIDFLRKHYSVPWGSAASGGGITSGLSSPARFGTESRSVNGSGLLSSALEASGESQRRMQRPSLLDRLEAAVAGGYATSPSGLPRVLPSRDGVHTDNHSGGAGDVDVEELAASGEVVLTNNTAPTFPSLIRATARDRWHGGNHLSQSSAPPAASGDAPAVGADPAGQYRKGGDESANSAAAATLAFGGVGEGGMLSDFFYGHSRRRGQAALFVEGYGPLEALSEEWVEYPPAIHAAATAVPLGDALEKASSGSVDRAGAASTATRASRPTTAIAAAAALRRSSSRPNNRSPSSLRAGENGGGHGFGVSGAAQAVHTAPAAAVRMEPFVMPSLEDTEVVIRRIQRDVNGLNAVAREQRRERDFARLRNGRVVKHRAAVAAALGTPDEQEQELLETWRSLFARVDHDALRRASVPAALREEGGPDYMKRELRHLANAPVPVEDPLWRYTTDMQAWQDQHGGGGGRMDASPMGMAGSAAAQDGPRRVVATIGTSRLGVSPAPLQSPTAQMDAADTQAWVRQREDFFAAYKQLLDHPTQHVAGGSAAQTLAPPALRFTPAPPPTPARAESGRGGTRAAAATAATTPVRDCSYTAAFAERATSSPVAAIGHSSARTPSAGSLAVQSVPSAASLPSVASPPIPAMDTSADFYLRHPKPDLPARYESTPSHSYTQEDRLTPCAVDDRVALTPPQERWNPDETEDYSSGVLDEEGEEDEEEEEEEHSAVLGGPDLHETTMEDSGSAVAADAGAEVVFAEEEEEAVGQSDPHDHVGQDAFENEEDHPAWLDI